MTKSRILKSIPYKNTTLSSVVIHALGTGKGITWLDRVRIPFDHNDSIEAKNPHTVGYIGKYGIYSVSNPIRYQIPQGRFPANLLCSDDILNDGRTTKSNPHPRTQSSGKMNVYGKYKGYTDQGGWNDSGSYSRYFDLDNWWFTLLERIKHENSDI